MGYLGMAALTGLCLTSGGDALQLRFRRQKSYRREGSVFLGRNRTSLPAVQILGYLACRAASHRIRLDFPVLDVRVGSALPHPSSEHSRLPDPDVATCGGSAALLPCVVPARTACMGAVLAPSNGRRRSPCRLPRILADRRASFGHAWKPTTYQRRPAEVIISPDAAICPGVERARIRRHSLCPSRTICDMPGAATEATSLGMWASVVPTC